MIKRYQPGWNLGMQAIVHAETESGTFVKYADHAAEVARLNEKLRALAAENYDLKDSVENAAGCIHAAEVEGLIEALEEKDGERLSDLIHRRLCHAYLPVETTATDAILREVGARVFDGYANELQSAAASNRKNGHLMAADHLSSEALRAEIYADRIRAGEVKP